MTVLYSYILWITPSHMHNFMQLSTEHCNIVLKYCIRKYISLSKWGFDFTYSCSNTPYYICSRDYSCFVRSHLLPFISRREPFLPVFRSCFDKVCVRDLLGSRYSISPRVLLHMDQCVYNYSSGSDLHHTVRYQRCAGYSISPSICDTESFGTNRWPVR
jgi:hypothetical protein